MNPLPSKDRWQGDRPHMPHVKQIARTQLFRVAFFVLFFLFLFKNGKYILIVTNIIETLTKGANPGTYFRCS